MEMFAPTYILLPLIKGVTCCNHLQSAINIFKGIIRIIYKLGEYENVCVLEQKAILKELFAVQNKLISHLSQAQSILSYHSFQGSKIIYLYRKLHFAITQIISSQLS